MATAGLMAISAGIVDWEPDAFVEGVRGLFRDWARARGSGARSNRGKRRSWRSPRSYFGRYGEKAGSTTPMSPISSR